MPGPTKSKRATPTVVSPSARPDRTSTVVAATLILLTVMGVLTVFWEPLAALAQGGATSSTNESPSEPRAASSDAGATATPSSPPPDASGSS